jgi:UrcA family protein
MQTSFTLSSARVAGIAKRTVFAAIGATTLALFSINASAQAPAPQLQVDFEDLDLSKSTDTERLYRRLRNASQAVCADFAKYSSVRMRDRHRECMDRALTGAIETIGHPSLTALHASKTDMKLAQRGSNASSKS